MRLIVLCFDYFTLSIKGRTDTNRDNIFLVLLKLQDNKPKQEHGHDFETVKNQCHILQLGSLKTYCLEVLLRSLDLETIIYIENCHLQSHPELDCLATRKNYSTIQFYKSLTKQDVSGERKKATGINIIFSPECYKIQKKKLQALTGNQKKSGKTLEKKKSSTFVV